MGAREFHLKRAAHHKRAASHLAESAEFVDWAVVALFYAAHQMVHSSLSGEPLPKDERHPRKHNSYGGPGTGGRGTNQLVRDLYPPPVHLANRSLFEASLRTRYDFAQLGTQSALNSFYAQCDVVEMHCKMLNMTRRDLPTESP